MNKKITIIPHTLEKIILAAFLRLLIVVSYIAFFVIIYTIMQKIIDHNYEQLILLTIGCMVSLTIAIILTKPFKTVKHQAGLKKDSLIQLKLVAIKQVYTHESLVGYLLYFPTLFTFEDSIGTQYEMEHLLSKKACELYEKALEEKDPRLNIEVNEYENEHYLDLPGLIDFRSRFDSEPVVVGLNKIERQTCRV